MTYPTKASPVHMPPDDIPRKSIAYARAFW